MTLTLAPYDAPLTGIETVSRTKVTGSVAVASNSTTGTLRLGFVRAPRTDPMTKVRMACVTAPSGGTPSLIRIGIYAVTLGTDNQPSASLTLVGSTANDTSLLAASGTEYEKALQATLNVVRGQWYAIGPLVVPGAGVTGPAVAGFSAASAPMMAGGNTRPRLATSIGGQSDLPSTVTVGSLGNTSFVPYILLER